MATLLGGYRCVDPRDLYRQCVARNLPTGAWWGKANLFPLVAGRGPGVGHVLLQLADLDALPTAADLTLTFSGEDARHIVRLAPITLLRAECVVPGGTGDGEAVFLCEVADRRHHLARIPLPNGFAAYNVSAANGGSFLSATLNSGLAWTWQGVVDALVTVLGESTSAFVIPFVPDSAPENLVFDGCSAWEALCRVLDRLACAAALDPVTNTFSVVRLGAAGDAALAALDDKGRTWDGYSAEYARGWRPETVRVRFLRRPVPDDGGSPYHTVDVTLPAATGVKAGTCEVLDDDLTALGATGSPSNAAALIVRAQERADDWLRKRSGYERRLVRAYRDFQPGTPAAVAAAVAGATLDDRGAGPMQTWVRAEPDGRLEAFRPLGDYPPWWPVAAGGTTSYGDVIGPDAARTGQVAVFTDPSGRFIGPARGDTGVDAIGNVIKNGVVELIGAGAASPAWKTPPARARTTAALPSCTYSNGTAGVGATLTGTSDGALAAQDGVTLSVNQDLLVADQATQAHNGPYTLTQVGDGSHPFILTRRTDADTAAKLLGATIAVMEGTLCGDTVWMCTANATITVGTTALPWKKTNGPLGSGTDNRVVRWDGTDAIQDSLCVITDLGNVGIMGRYYTSTTLAGGDNASLESSPRPAVRLGVSGASYSIEAYATGLPGLIVTLPDTHHFVLRGTPSLTPTSSYAVMREGPLSPPPLPGPTLITHVGIDATCTVKVGGVDKTQTIKGGIIVDIS